MRNWRLPLTALALSLVLLGCPPSTPAPTANAGPDQTVSLGDTVTLDGTGSSASDGGSLTYQWQFIVRPDGSLSVLSGAGTTSPQFTTDRPGAYSLRLTVIDSAGQKAIDSVVVMVMGALATVPDLIGLTEEEAEAALTDAGLGKGAVTMANSGTVPAGHIISHDPASGEEVLPGSTVDLIISTGPATVTVPDVAGQTRDNAEATLANAGLQTGDITFENSETVAAGSVIRTSPAADQTVNEGTSVDLVISLGPASSNQVAVPDVTGQVRATAEAALTTAGLVVGDVTFENSETVAAGAVIRTSPAASSIVTSGASVELVVSIGPASDIDVVVPDLAGLTQSEAATALANVGLNLGAVLQRPDDSASPGTVIDQDPAADTTLNEGAFVAITLAIAPIDIRISTTIDVRSALGDIGDGNVLRPDAMAADSTTGEIFIAARLTPHIAVYDTALAAITGALETNFVLPGEKRLFLSPGGPSLYVFDPATQVLARIDRGTKTETANTPLDGGFLDLVADTGRNRLYVVREQTPGFLVLNATTLAQISTSTVLDGVAGDLQMDNSGAQLLVLNTTLEANAGELRTYDPATDTITDTVSFDMPGSGASAARQLDYDPNGDRFFVRTDAAFGVYAMDGSNPRSLPLPSNMLSTGMVYDPASDRLIALALSLQAVDSAAYRGASLLTYIPSLGQSTSPQETIALGELNGQLALDTSTNTLLSTDHATGTVWSLATNPFPAEASFFELGVGIDQILLEGDRVIGASRLGNSLLFQFTPGMPAVTAFTAGTWPGPAALVGSGSGAPVLAVVNAWDSTVSLLSTGATPTALNTFDTGFSLGTTEDLPGLAVSPSGSQIAVAYPEFKRVAILDAGDGGIITTIDYPAFDNGDEPEGAGQLQLLFDRSGDGYFFVFDRISRFLYRYDATSGFAPLSTANLASRFPDMDDAPATGWLFQDVEAGELFVGPVRVNPATGMASGDLLPNTQVVRGLDSLFDLYWTVEQVGTSTGFATIIRSVDRSANGAAAFELALPENHPISPEVAFDTASRQFHVAYPESAVIETYAY